MICTRCGARSDASPSPTPETRRCQHCAHPIAFDPRAGDPVSDKMFARVLERASAGGKLRFTVDQLYYDLRRTLGPFPRPLFDELWARWQTAHGPPAALVRPWPARDHSPASGGGEPDIGDYSFDRVVITDSAWMVDFLLWNNLHFETNAAVLCIDGYPDDRFALIRAMLGQNPEIVVIALHDASLEGCAMPRRLVSEDGWFREHGYVIDAGLSPAHRSLYSELWREREPEPETPPPAAPEHLDAEARAWLSRYSLDLAVVRPEKLMRRLFRAGRLYPGHKDDLRVGQIHVDDELFGPGRRRRLERGEELRF